MKHVRRLIKSSGLTEAQRAFTLDSYVPTKATQGMLEMARQYLDQFDAIAAGPDPEKGIGLMGSVGIGKTHILLAIGNELLRRRVPVLFVVTPDLMAELREAQFEQKLSEGLNAKVERISRAPVAIFDDVGKENATEWVRVQYYRIINARYNRRLPTLFSSNYGFPEIEDRLGDATSSRLYALTKGRQVFIQSADYRLT